ncbi:hypothetical protein D3273_14200 [Lichenibacterium minor]|uniref:Uncharacterized protein n=1 Tax=Lichenibacterium minor TaxID=2316528 RepID=A0A4Q2U8H5_9HYPH|nr:hypothetical protein [Lichenibacterium minor]RYC31266.1 hypothetical protein D3273_14200 [Lichenibacterium minor]
MIIPFKDPCRSRVDPEVLGRQIWDEIHRLYVEWANAVEMQDDVQALIMEQQVRVFALVYASLVLDGHAVTTGRKAIVRSIYARLGGADTINVVAMVNAVIAREEAAARP